LPRAGEQTDFIPAVVVDEIAIVVVSVVAIAFLVGLWRWWRRRGG
jgi:cell division protein FtsW (lipid II flippase)